MCNFYIIQQDRNRRLNPIPYAICDKLGIEKNTFWPWFSYPHPLPPSLLVLWVILRIETGNRETGTGKSLWSRGRTGIIFDAVVHGLLPIDHHVHENVLPLSVRPTHSYACELVNEHQSYSFPILTATGPQVPDLWVKEMMCMWNASNQWPYTWTYSQLTSD